VSDKPNIVLVMTDTQGWNALGECGEGFAETPNIDDIADQGVRFDNTYASAVPCTPSRAGLFSGKHSHAAGAWTNNRRLQKGVRTMGHYLRQEGYRTAYVGKWHLDGDYFGTGEAAPGYDPEWWYDGQNYREDIGEDLWEWYRSGMDTRVAENDIDEIHERGITREDTWGGRITDRALEFIEDARGDDQPFLLVVSYDEPHEPSLCPPPYCEMYRDERYPLPDNYETPDDLRAHGKPDRQIEEAEEFAAGGQFIDSIVDAEEEGGIYRPLYFAASTFIDDEIGRIADAIEENHPESVFAFTSDHGHYLGAHGVDAKGFQMYDEVTNVPLIVRGSSLPSGTVSDALVSQTDLLPTFLDLAGGDLPSDLVGRSFLENARDPTTDHREDALIEYHSYSGTDFYPVRALVTEQYKLVVNMLETDELYDLETDPGELHNRINDPEYADVRDDLHDRLLARMEDTDDDFRGDVWADRPWRDD